MRAEHGDFEPTWKAAPRQIVPHLRGLGRGLLDLILPPASLDGASALTGGLSPAAFAKVTFIDDPVCDGCGLAMPYADAAAERCLACQAKPKAFARARAACVYDEASRSLILRFKHGDQQQFAALFARWISRAGAELVAEADAVVPVPLHPLRLLSRRFNQAAEIARPLARRAGLDYLPDALIRASHTASQGGKSRRGRRLNVKKAFAVTEAGRRRLKGRRILLIDDVLTTGATGEACARAPLDAGARAVDLAVIARVRNARELTM